MIQGRFGDNNELLFEIELITVDGLELLTEAILDTGFSDWLVIDKQDLEGLGWFSVGEEAMKMVKGYADFDIYLGIVKLDNQNYNIPIHVGEGINEILLGRKWLENRKLVVDISRKLLSLEIIKI